MNTKDWDFSLGETARIETSGETGRVIARAEYLESSDNYLIRYKAADGRGVESWWNANALVSVSE